MWLEDTTSPSTSSRSTTRVSKRLSARSSSSSPAALWPKRKFSPTLTCSACSVPTSTSSMKLCALRPANSASNGMTTSSCDAELADELGLALERRQQARRAARRDDRRGVRLEGDDGVGAADDLAVAEVDAVEGADGDAPRARLAPRRAGVTFIRGTLRRASAGRPRGARRWPPARRRRPAGRARPRPRRRCVWPWPARHAGVGVDLDARQEGERLLERQDALRIGVLDVERPDARAPQLLAVGVAQLGDRASARRSRPSTRSGTRRGRPRASCCSKR